MSNKVLAIINPVSANEKTGKLWPLFYRQFQQAGIKLKPVYTEWSGQATEIAREGLKNGYQRIMAVGGDGTLNEVVNGFFAGEKKINPSANLIVFSQGTGSDYIKSTGLDNNIEEVIKVIKRNRQKLIDLGLVTYVTHVGLKDKRYFINVADMGIGGETTNLVNNSSKILGGFLTYLIGALRVLLRYQNKVINLKIDAQEGKHYKVNSVMIANGSYFGGGMMIAPGADLKDGLFNIVKIGDLSKREFIFNIIKAYSGRHLEHPKVDMSFAQKLTARSQERVLLEIDGETIGTLPAHFEIRPAALSICY